MTALPWYKDGLKFKCTGCGKCCTGEPGLVWISPEEVKNISSYLNITERVFRIRFTRSQDNRLALIEKKNEAGEFDCIFLKGKKCEIYPVRPKQCQTFPWWKHTLSSPESWKLAAESCEGINDDAPIVPYAEIEQNLARNSQT